MQTFLKSIKPRTILFERNESPGLTITKQIQHTRTFGEGFFFCGVCVDGSALIESWVLHMMTKYTKVKFLIIIPNLGKGNVCSPWVLELCESFEAEALKCDKNHSKFRFFFLRIFYLFIDIYWNILTVIIVCKGSNDSNTIGVLFSTFSVLMACFFFGVAGITAGAEVCLTGVISEM